MAIVLVPLAAAAVWGYLSWRATYAEAMVTVQRNADLVREYVLRLVQTQRALLDAADAYFAGAPAAALRDRRFHDFLARIETKQPYAFGIAYIDQSGEFVASSRAYPTRGNVADRPYVARHRAGDKFFIDRLVLRPGNQDALVITQRRSGDTYTGLFASSVDVSVITEFLRRIASAPGSSASLLREDGRLLVRNHVSDPVTLEPTAPIYRATREADRGTFEAMARTDGVTRLYGFSRVGDLPLFANYGLSKRTLLAEWGLNFGINLAFLAAVAAVALLALQQAERRFGADRARMEAEFDRKLLDEARQTAHLKETMLRELSHRMKNNLQSVQALIRLKGGGAPEAFAEEMSQRVAAISDIHDLLYTSGDNVNIDLRDFLLRVCGNESLFPPERGVKAECDLVELPIGFSQATPLALVVVELVTNAVKHAFAGRPGGTILIKLRRAERCATLEIADDGVGLPAEPARNSGLRLVRGLVDQIEGSLEVESGAGTRYRIHFPVSNRI